MRLVLHLDPWRAMTDYHSVGFLHGNHLSSNEALTALANARIDHGSVLYTHGCRGNRSYLHHPVRSRFALQPPLTERLTGYRCNNAVTWCVGVPLSRIVLASTTQSMVYYNTACYNGRDVGTGLN